MKPLPTPRQLPILSILLVVATSGLLAQGRKLEHTLLWEISGKGLKRPSYLYGTFHVEDKRVFDFTDSVLLKFHECTTFASEIVLDSAVREVFRRALEGHGSSDEEADDGSDAVATPDGVEEPIDPTSDSSGPTGLGLSPDTTESAEEPVADNPEDGSTSRSRKGTIFDSDLFKTQRARRRPGDKPVFLDAYLYQLAKDERKQIIGLERVSEQLDLAEPSFLDFSKFFFDRRRRGKRRIFRGREESQEEMIRYYHEGDLNQLLSIMEESFPPEYFKRLLTDRNHHMTDRAVRYIEEAPTFIAVGAGHLPGREGMIELFRRKGYTVRPVRSTRTGLAAEYRSPVEHENWIGFAPSDGGFTVELPVDPIDISPLATDDDEDDDIGPETTIYGWPDIGTGIEYFVGYTDYHDVPRLASYQEFNDWVKSIYDDGKEKILDSVRTVYAGTLRGSEVETDEDDSRQRTRYFLRGERLYRLKVLTVPELINSDRVERFFSTFHLDPPAPVSWTPFSPPDSGFTVSFPAAPRLSDGEDIAPHMGAREIFSSVDKYSGMAYRVERAEFPEYFQESGADTILVRGLGYRGMMRDTNRRFFTLEGMPAMDVDIPVTGTITQRERLLLRGRYLYRLHASIDRAGDSTGAITFFNSFRASGDTAISWLFTDKTGAILRDIGSPDASVRRRAVLAAMTHDFTSRNLPEIHALLRRSYPDDAEDEHGTRATLFGLVSDLGDTSSLEVIREIYPTLPESPELRASALTALVGIGSRASLDLFRELLAKEPTLSRMDVDPLFYPLYDDIRSSAPLFPGIFSFLDTKSLRAPVYDLTITALDSGVITPASIAGEKHTILWDGIGLLMLRRDLSQDDSEYTGNTYQLRMVAELLGYFPGDSEVVSFLGRVVVDRDKDLALAAAAALLRLRRNPPADILENLAADDLLRGDLYRKLDAIGRTESFPATYRNQESIARSLLVEWNFDEDYGPIDSLTVLDRRIVTYHGKRGRAYLFKFKFDNPTEEGKWYVGISGLQPEETDRISADGEIVGSRYELLEKMSIDEHYRSLMADD